MTDPLDAQERARQTMESVQVGGGNSAFRLEDVIAEQIRQAEQAAREKALESLETAVNQIVVKYYNVSTVERGGGLKESAKSAALKDVKEAIRALKEKP